MRIRKLALRLLRIAGLLLIALGVVHLLATSHMPGLLEEMRGSRNYQLAVGATLLNHVLVGLLLLPLGYTTWLAASENHVKDDWARKVLRVNAAAALALPVSAAFFLRQSEFYSSPLFFAGMTLASLIALLVLAATVLTTRSPQS